MVWNIELQRAATLLAAIILACMFLSSCVAETPQTHLSWGVRDTLESPRPTAPRYASTHRVPVQSAALDCPTPRPKPAWYTASNLAPPSMPTAEPAVSDGSTPSFVWPMSGRVISDFGVSGSGQRNDGINIAAPLGTPIRAAAAGTVSYAGNELKGYGNLILIKHDNGYVTAYAHAESIVVNLGDTVAKGQIIAYAGTTGDVSTPQLHFEIRHGVQPLNPRSMLLASNAS
jgi:murein DD-endopeptidase MepM/ murein hydrolase activator NlpD